MHDITCVGSLSPTLRLKAVVIHLLYLHALHFLITYPFTDLFCILLRIDPYFLEFVAYSTTSVTSPQKGGLQTYILHMDHPAIIASAVQ